LRGPGGRHGPADRRVPVRVRVPFLRAVAEVREPERDARQERRVPPARGDGASVGGTSVRAIFASSVRAPSESRAVTPLELFFDLVYVFAISQLSEHLVE